MLTRIISGIVLSGFVLWFILNSSSTEFFLFFELIVLIAAWEAVSLFKPAEGKIFVLMSLSGTVILSSLIYLGRIDALLVAIGSITIVVSMLAILGDDENAKSRLVNTLFLVIFLSVLFTSIPLIRSRISGDHLLLCLIFVNAAVDIGAYFTGKAIGRRKLAPLISPNKTIEGAIGGVVFAFIVSFLFVYFEFGLDIYSGVALALIASTVGPFGDLIISKLKRAASVKDTGFIIPGHGGVLDRIDSLIFTGSAFFVFLTLSDSINRF